MRHILLLKKKKKMCKVSIDIWNKYVDKSNNEINAEAKDGDIVIKHNGLLFLLQTKNGYNNVIIFINIFIPNVYANFTHFFPPKQK